MLVNQGIFDQLIEFGIEPVLAREAAKRYHTVEAAADWCFGSGANWKPEPVDEELPSYDYSGPRRLPEVHVEHREVVEDETSSNDATPLESGASSITSPSITPAPPPMPPRPSTTFSMLSQPPGRIELGSNNPFRNNPPPPSQARVDDEDEELQRAIRMSQEDQNMDDEERRQERERSVRATAPPPSPDAEEGEVLGTLFGPSNKEEEGQTGMVRAQGPSTSTEDEDLNRAIQDSLMTASFHSASAQQNTERPQAAPRKAGAPLVFASPSGRSTLAASFLQALHAVPQFRESVLGSQPLAQSLKAETHASMRALQRVSGPEVQMSKDSFEDVDDDLEALGWTYGSDRLPPVEPCQRLVNRVHELIQVVLFDQVSDPEWNKLPARPTGGAWDEPSVLFQTSIASIPHQHATHVNFRRSANFSNEIYPHLASILWTPEAPGQSIESFSEILSVFIDWEYGAPRELWKLDERVVLDRFLKENAAWSTQIRAQQAVAVGNVRRLKEQIDRLTVHKGTNFHDSLKALIKHYELSPESPDPMVAESKREMKQRLEETLATLTVKVEALQEELEAETKAANGALFESLDPLRNQHVYLLRAVLFYDGVVVGRQQGHLYAYIRADDGGWWKVQDHEATAVEWKDVAGDSTGLYMDGGPYLLIYSRDGPRPRVPEPEIEAESLEPSATQSFAQSDEQRETSSDLPEDSLLGLHIPQADQESAEAAGGVQDVADVSMEDEEQLISLESAEGTPTAETGEGETVEAGSKGIGGTEATEGSQATEATKAIHKTGGKEGTETAEAAEAAARTEEADVQMS